jgi:hypothetical protein
VLVRSVAVVVVGDDGEKPRATPQEQPLARMATRDSWCDFIAVLSFVRSFATWAYCAFANRSFALYPGVIVQQSASLDPFESIDPVDAVENILFDNSTTDREVVVFGGNSEDRRKSLY